MFCVFVQVWLLGAHSDYRPGGTSVGLILRCAKLGAAQELQLAGTSPPVGLRRCGLRSAHVGSEAVHSIPSQHLRLHVSHLGPSCPGGPLVRIRAALQALSHLARLPDVDADLVGVGDLFNREDYVRLRLHSLQYVAAVLLVWQSQDYATEAATFRQRQAFSTVLN